MMLPLRSLRCGQKRATEVVNGEGGLWEACICRRSKRVVWQSPSIKEQRFKMNSKIRISILLAVVLALALSPSAFAQSGAQLDGYSDQAGQVQSQVAPDRASGDDGGVAPVAVSGDGGGEDSALPFTGLDLALIGIVGAGLVLLGFGLRRLTRAPQPS